MTLRRLIYIIMCIAAVGLMAEAHPALPKPKPAKLRADRPRRSRPAPQPFDTIEPGLTDTIAVSGYDKKSRSMRESMFVSNRSGRPLRGLQLEVNYYDSSDRQLHQASHWVSADIPAGETRMVDVPTFDRQGSFHYYLSPPSRSTASTPFKVKVKVLRIIIDHK